MGLKIIRFKWIDKKNGNITLEKALITNSKFLIN